MRTIGAVVRKDLRLELRTGEVVPAMALFAITAFVLFHFGLQRDELDGPDAAGVLLVTLLLAATLGTVRLFVAEREQEGLEPALLALELIAVPGFALLLLGPGLSGGEILRLVLVLFALDVGLAIVGTLVSALAVQTRARELIAPMLGLPLLIPARIAAGRCTAPLLERGAGGGIPGTWLAVLGLYDLVFVLLAYAVFDFLLED